MIDGAPHPVERAFMQSGREFVCWIRFRRVGNDSPA